MNYAVHSSSFMTIVHKKRELFYHKEFSFEYFIISSWLLPLQTAESLLYRCRHRLGGAEQSIKPTHQILKRTRRHPGEQPTYQ